MGNYEALGPEGDFSAPLRNLAKGLIYTPNNGIESKLVVNPTALDGPDIWLDPKVPKILFLSDALVSGLKTTGVDKGWGLVRVPVGTL